MKKNDINKMKGIIKKINDCNQKIKKIRDNSDSEDSGKFKKYSKTILATKTPDTKR